MKLSRLYKSPPIEGSNSFNATSRVFLRPISGDMIFTSFSGCFSLNKYFCQSRVYVIRSFGRLLIWENLQNPVARTLHQSHPSTRPNRWEFYPEMCTNALTGFIGASIALCENAITLELLVKSAGVNPHSNALCSTMGAIKKDLAHDSKSLRFANKRQKFRNVFYLLRLQAMTDLFDAYHECRGLDETEAFVGVLIGELIAREAVDRR